MLIHTYKHGCLVRDALLVLLAGVSLLGPSDCQENGKDDEELPGQKAQDNESVDSSHLPLKETIGGLPELLHNRSLGGGVENEDHDSSHGGEVHDIEANRAPQNATLPQLYLSFLVLLPLLQLLVPFCGMHRLSIDARDTAMLPLKLIQGLLPQFAISTICLHSVLRVDSQALSPDPEEGDDEVTHRVQHHKRHVGTVAVLVASGDAAEADLIIQLPPEESATENGHCKELHSKDENGDKHKVLH